MKKIIILFSIIGIFFFSGCEKFLDVNENPNSPTDVEDFLILPAAQASVANVMSAEYGIVGSFWSQHWVQNNTSSQYKTFETYTLSSNDGFVDNSYFELYTGGLSDNEIIHLKAKAEENWGLYLMTSTLKAFAFQYLVDLYDNVPYNDAFKADVGIINPAINGGQQIYDSIYKLLNVALSKDLSKFESAKYSSYDLLCGAQTSKWKAFANSLKLRILLRQYSARTEFVRGELGTLLASGTFLASDVALRNFEDADSKSNPLYESDQRQLNTRNNIRANATFISYLTANKDPRISVLFDSVGGDIVGMVTGSYEVPSTEFVATDYIANPNFSAEMPVNFMTVAESELLLAEAYLRMGNTDAAKTHYDAGVTSSFTRLGVDVDTLLNEGKAYAFPASGFDAQLEAIIMQKWVDAADGQRGIESFIEQVRTGIPRLSAISSSIPAGAWSTDLITNPEYIPGTLIYSKKGSTSGRLPVRLPYADSELNYNSNAAPYKDLFDADVMQTKVWWNK